MVPIACSRLRHLGDQGLRVVDPGFRLGMAAFVIQNVAYTWS
jgi:hypothetical protein